MNKYLVIPSCSDYNRGDQALVWESVRLAQDAGFDGKFYMLTCPEPTKQTQTEGIDIFQPILEHPSRVFKSKKNISYNGLLKIKWGIVGLFDLMFSLYVLLALKLKILPIILTESKKKTIQLYKECDAVFVKGGGFLHAYGGIVAGYFIYYNLFHIILALVLKKKVYILPNSIGPLDGFMVKPMIRFVFKRAEIVMCRESISKNYIDSIVDCNSKLAPDLAFYLQEDKAFNVEQYLEDNGVPIKEKKCVSITVRPYRFPGHSNGKELYDNYIKCMIEFSRYLINKGYFPVFVQQTLANNSHEDDTISIEQITKMLDKDRFTKLYDKDLNCKKLKSIYSKMYCIVGTRFHSVIFSLSSYIPAISIAYGGNKSVGIMKDNGLDDFVIPIEDITLDLLISMFTNMITNYNINMNEIKHKVCRIQAKRVDLVEQIKKGRK